MLSSMKIMIFRLTSMFMKYSGYHPVAKRHRAERGIMLNGTASK